MEDVAVTNVAVVANNVDGVMFHVNAKKNAATGYVVAKCVVVGKNAENVVRKTVVVAAKSVVKKAAVVAKAENASKATEAASEAAVTVSGTNAVSNPTASSRTLKKRQLRLFFNATFSLFVLQLLLQNFPLSSQDLHLVHNA